MGEGEMEVQIITSSPKARSSSRPQSPDIIPSTLCCCKYPRNISLALYDKFNSCKSQTTFLTTPKDQVACDNHPFFMDCLDICEELKALFNEVFVAEGDIFENCAF